MDLSTRRRSTKKGATKTYQILQMPEAGGGPVRASSGVREDVLREAGDGQAALAAVPAAASGRPDAVLAAGAGRGGPRARSRPGRGARGTRVPPCGRSSGSWRARLGGWSISLGNVELPSSRAIGDGGPLAEALRGAAWSGASWPGWRRPGPGSTRCWTRGPCSSGCVGSRRCWPAGNVAEGNRGAAPGGRARGLPLRRPGGAEDAPARALRGVDGLAVAGRRAGTPAGRGPGRMTARRTGPTRWNSPSPVGRYRTWTGIHAAEVYAEARRRDGPSQPAGPALRKGWT